MEMVELLVVQNGSSIYEWPVSFVGMFVGPVDGVDSIGVEQRLEGWVAGPSISGLQVNNNYSTFIIKYR